MQPKTIQQINAELGSIYDPQVENVRRQQADIPGMVQAEEAGLGAKQEQAFGDILGGARRRGLGFSGIPLSEQAKYTSTEYLPALARLRQSGREQSMKLEDAILGINERRAQHAQGNYQYESTLAEQRRQFDEQAAQQRAAQAAAFSPSFGGMPTTAGNPKSASAVKRADGGFNYTAPNGQPISAAAYAAAKNKPFRQVLAEAAKQGDKGAQAALGFVGDDFGYDPRKVNSKQQIDLYNSLVWGVKPAAGFSSPAPQKSAGIGGLFSNFGGLVAPRGGGW